MAGYNHVDGTRTGESRGRGRAWLRAPSARGWWGLGTRLRPFSRDPRAWAGRSLTSGPYLIFVYYNSSQIRRRHERSQHYASAAQGRPRGHYSARDVLPHPGPPPAPQAGPARSENQSCLHVWLSEEARDTITISSIVMTLQPKNRPGARANHIPATGNVSPPSRSSQDSSPIPPANRFDLLVNGQV